MDQQSRVQEGCERLLAAYRSQDIDPELGEPLSDAEISKLTSWFPCPLPDELRELYRWHNGQPRDTWQTDAVFWFRDMQYTSLDRVQFEYQSMMESYGVDNSREEEGVDLSTCFPFASFNGGWYVYPCDGQDINRKVRSPIICVMQGISVHYYSMEAMLATCTDWVVSSMYSDKVGRDLSEQLEKIIWRKHNPGIFDRAV